MSEPTSILEPKPRPSPAPQRPLPPEPQEDAESQALSDALKSSFGIVRVILVVMVIVFLGSGFFTVGTQEKAVILRLGKPVGKDDKALLGPGAHWAFPYPIDEVVRIPVGQVQTMRSTVGWYTETPGIQQPPPPDSLPPGAEGYTLTADGNIIHVRGTLRYRVAEPGLQYEFGFAGASNLVLNALNNALIYASATYTADNALTRDVAGFRDKVRTRLEETIRRQNLGIVVDLIDVQAVPPRKLKEAFAAVSEAEARRGKEINLARSSANETINKARSEAALRIAAGETDRTRLVTFVAAEGERFKGLLPEYQKNPALFRNLRRSETLQRIFANPQIDSKFMLPTRGDGKREMRIQLGREPEKIKPIELPREEGH
jgi:membrane protease subunit HflK